MHDDAKIQVKRHNAVLDLSRQFCFYYYIIQNGNLRIKINKAISSLFGCTTRYLK